MVFAFDAGVPPQATPVHTGAWHSVDEVSFLFFDMVFPGFESRREMIAFFSGNDGNSVML